MTASSLGVRLAKEEDRDYLAVLFPSYISEWSPIVDGGVLALPMSANEDPTTAPRGAPFDPEEIPELVVATDDPAARTLLISNAIDLAAEQTAPGISSATPLPGFEELAPGKFFRRF